MKVFLSHSTKDKSFVDKLYDDLVTGEIDIFYDKYSITKGEFIPNAINKGISEIDFFILIISKNSNNSNWVNLEMNSALTNLMKNGKPILIPVIIDNSIIPPILNSLNYIRISNEIEYKLGVNQIKDVLGLNNVGDDPRDKDYQLYNLPKRERKALYNSYLPILMESEYSTDRIDSLLLAYKERNFESHFSGRVFNNAFSLANDIVTSQIKSNKYVKSKSDRPFVISICGFPGLGKTTFARGLKLALNKYLNIDSTVVEFERWMIDRKERWDNELNLVSGFEIVSFKFNDLVNSVKSLVSGNEIVYPLREHGNKVNEAKLIPKKIIILDGVISFMDEFNTLSDYNIFFDADIATRYLLSITKDRYVREYTPNRAVNKFWIHDMTYPKSISVFKNRANEIVISDLFNNYIYYQKNET